MKPLIIALLIAGGASPPVLPATDEPRIDMNAVALIECGGHARGTAFWIGETRMVTAAHVSHNGPCRTVDGDVPLETVREDGANDIAELRGPNVGHHLDIDCRGIREGKIYFATGYPMGLYRHTSRLMATRYRAADNGMVVLFGEVFPGMSGGPIVDRQHGRVAGITNRKAAGLPFMQSRALADTFICEGGGR